MKTYSVSILGSAAGIVLFSGCAWLELGPGWWFSFIAAGLGYFLLQRPLSLRHAKSAVLLVLVVVLASRTALTTSADDRMEFWSPYYRIDYFVKPAVVRVNLIGHQEMVSCQTSFPAYALPHLLNRDTGGKRFENVLVIGAGSGNDVSRALQWGARHVDAVEIDPVILALGASYHPDKPYSESSRVTTHQGDGRNFLRSTDRQYDLIVYALLDSLVLHSSYSNIRLESYLFTEEAFRDVKRCLKPGGLFVMYNYFRQGWIVSRLQKTLTAVFDTPPLVFTLPHRDKIDAAESWWGFTFFMAGEAPALQPLRRAFTQRAESENGVRYWLKRKRIPDPDSPNGFEPHPSEAEQKDWIPIGVAQVDEPADLEIATDDWPFLYLRRRMLPDLSLRGAAIMAGVALILLLWFLPRRESLTGQGWEEEIGAVVRYWSTRHAGETGWRFFDGRMFFLGAGFMLIETKAVVHMALLFGSTWMVNSFVFFAILVMILLANLLVLTLRPRLRWPSYVCLFMALVLNAAVPLDFFLGWTPVLQVLTSCLLVFAPVLFAAVIFGVSFSRSAEADRALGFNIAGAMVGGLAEYSSMLLGFRNLEMVALGFYVAAALWRDHMPQAESATRA
jgi:spermidine synthase